MHLCPQWTDDLLLMGNNNDENNLFFLIYIPPFQTAKVTLQFKHVQGRAVTG